MKRKTRLSLTIIIILIVIFLSVLVLQKPKPTISEELTKCIGKNSELYTQLGCHACEIQEDLFGENYRYLTIIDCFYEQDKCMKIQYTPTWIINGKEIAGVQSIETLKELTGC